MSYIDSFDHELVGFFAGLPLYHPLETVTGTGGRNFSCTPSQLVLGQGSDEQAAVVLTNPTAAVVAFLIEVGPLPPGPLSSDDADQFIDAHLEPSGEYLHFAGWSAADYAAFHQRCTAPSLVTPYVDEEQDGAIECWLIANLGEFVYFCMPELAPDVRSRVAEVCALVRYPHYYNVQILPPGYVLPVSDRISSFSPLWGNYAWRAKRIKDNRLMTAAPNGPARAR